MAVRDLVAEVIDGFEGGFAPRGFALPNGLVSVALRLRAATLISRCMSTDLSLKPEELVMITVRSHDQYNTTVYGLDDRYRGVLGERRVIFMHPEDMADRGIASRSQVDIQSHFRGERREVHAFLAVPTICRAARWPAFPEANPLVPLESYAHRSYTPTSKYVVVTVT